MSSTIPKLAPELFFNIFEHLHDKPALASCSLVAKCCLRPCQRQLFSETTVTGIDRIIQFSLALEKSPNLKTHIKVLSLHGDDEYDPQEALVSSIRSSHKFPMAFKRIVSSHRTLGTLKLYNISWRFTPTPLQPLQQEIYTDLEFSPTQPRFLNLIIGQLQFLGTPSHPPELGLMEMFTFLGEVGLLQTSVFSGVTLEEGEEEEEG